MTNIETAGAQSRKKTGVARPKALSCKIDMTPMVDLGFLLISFFVITTELSRPVAMNLYMPADGTGTELGESNAMTIIPTAGNKLYYYFGKWEDAQKNNTIYTADYAGNNSIRRIINTKQLALDNDPKSKEKRKGLMMLIKPTQEASYKNMVDLLDEKAICLVEKYALLKITPDEDAWIKQHKVNE